MSSQTQDHTFTLSNTSPPIPVHLPPNLGLSKDTLLAFPPFHNWLTTLRHSLSLQKTYPSHAFHSDPYTLRSISIQAVDFFGNDRIGFVKLKSEIKNSAGESLPGSVFLRGGSVGILVVLEPNDIPKGSSYEHDDERHVILTVQPRIPAGSLAFSEIPAGMIDSNTGNIKGVAIQEIREECGIEIPSASIKEDDGSYSGLIDLTRLALESGHSSSASAQTRDDEEKLEDGVYPSPGGCDEFIKLFAYVHRVERGTLKEWKGKLTGNREEGEKITLRVVGFKDVWRATRDVKALSAWCLYRSLREAGRC